MGGSCSSFSQGCCYTECPEEKPSQGPSCLEQFEKFVKGQWEDLLIVSRVCCDRAAVARSRRTRRGDDIKSRAIRAEALVHLGELFPARQALEGAHLAPGSQQTLDMLRDQSKRPGEPRIPVPPDLVNHHPRSLFNLDGSMLLRNLRSAKRGAAGGPSGMTVEHLQQLLGHAKDSKLFSQAAERLARA